MPSTLIRYTRQVAATLVLALTWNGFAHAAKPSQHLAAAQRAAMSQEIPQNPNNHPAVIPPSDPESAQTAPQAAPIPAVAPPAASARDRMLAAHTVFLSRTGVDPYFAIADTAAFNTVLNALQQWGRYQVVTNVAQADLVLQLHGVATAYTAGGTGPQDPASISYTSSLQLTVADPQTLSPLWVVQVPVRTGYDRKLKTDRLAMSGESVVSQLKLLAGETLSPEEQATLQASQSSGHKLLWLGLLGAGALVGVTFLTLHFMRRNQAAFCQAHGLSPCPGA